MCGRYSFHLSREGVGALTGSAPDPFPRSSYNQPPGVAVPVLTGWGWETLPWGVQVPGGKLVINARAETVREKSMFRSAFRRDRCVLPASGFFEWRRQENASYPYYFYPRNDPGLLLAGIVVESSPESASRAVVLLTRAADPWMSEIHHRAPVLVRKKSLRKWLSYPDPETPLSHFCHATEDGTLSRYPVSDRVNRITENSPEILKPIPEPEVLTQGQLFS